MPCLFAGGGVPEGESRGAFVQPVDFLPTLCDLAGVGVHPPEPIQGKSFAEALVNGGDSARDFVVSGNYIVPDAEGHPPRRSPTPFLVTRQWGYAPVGAEGREELYDIGADPLATQDVAAGNEAVLEELRGLFLSHLSEHGIEEGLLGLWRSAGSGAGHWAIDY